MLSLTKSWTPCKHKAMSLKLQTHQKRKTLRMMAVPMETSVLFDYVDLYSKFLCVHDTPCIDQMVVPLLSEQYDVVKSFSTITHHLQHMHDLEGVVLKLLLTKDVEALNHLISTVEEYNANTEEIKSVIEYAQSLPLPSVGSSLQN